MRALLKPFAIHAAYSPIETIVFFSVIGTLAYFHILDGIKHSSFFAPTFPSTLRPASARLSQTEWLPVLEREWFAAWKHGEQALELQPIVFSLDDKARKVSFSRPLRFLSRIRSAMQPFRCVCLGDRDTTRHPVVPHVGALVLPFLLFCTYANG